MTTTYMRQLDKMGRLVIPKEIRDELSLKDQHLSMKPLKGGQGLKVFKENSPEDPKTLDRYGRLVVPIEMRQELGWDVGKKIEINVSNNEVVLNGKFEVCEICGKDKSLIKVNTNYLCEDCLNEANQGLVQRWASQLNSLKDDYVSYTERLLDFKDPEDVHQARVLGRRIEALLKFLNVSSNHQILDTLTEAHSQLGEIRERDVLIEAFKKLEEESDDEKKAEVFAQIHQRVEKKRVKYRDKLDRKLPKLVNNKFLDQWNNFIEAELPAYVLPLNIGERLEYYEKSFDQKAELFSEVFKEKGASSNKSLDSLHAVRISSKYLRYIYRYLNQMYDEDYKTKADHYEDIQDQFGDINDLKDWLDEIDNHTDKIDAKKKHVKAVKRQLKDELEKRMNEVNIEKIHS
ncbi:CHAD domain-containing protein [Halobacillus campisalis]|uniref:CHAD domain-containing protein n=1 Tax=Halobacillus campisalis TaxID=435909 RepID=A0ABW2K811_9BACI|nr:CHAD domain-containing protein [Halobacillus campisalis]